MQSWIQIILLFHQYIIYTSHFFVLECAIPSHTSVTSPVASVGGTWCLSLLHMVPRPLMSSWCATRHGVLEVVGSMKRLLIVFPTSCDCLCVRPVDVITSSHLFFSLPSLCQPSLYNIVTSTCILHKHEQTSNYTKRRIKNCIRMNAVQEHLKLDASQMR